MRVIFQDLQQPDNPVNGKRLECAVAMMEVFQSLSGRKPFLFELRGENGFMLMVGFAGNCGSVQYSPSDGSPPYLMAVPDDVVDDGNFVEFLAGNTPTPIARRFCLPIEQIEKIAYDFIEQGDKSGEVTWEEI